MVPYILLDMPYLFGIVVTIRSSPPMGGQVLAIESGATIAQDTPIRIDHGNHMELTQPPQLPTVLAGVTQLFDHALHREGGGTVIAILTGQH